MLDRQNRPRLAPAVFSFEPEPPDRADLAARRTTSHDARCSLAALIG
jgi:hypothetical protein